MKAGRLREAWRLTTSPSEVVGLGPFRLVSYVPAERIVLERNPFYWRQDADGKPLPRLARLTLAIVRDQDTELLRLQHGQIDIGSREIRPEDYAAVRRAVARAPCNWPMQVSVSIRTCCGSTCRPRPMPAIAASPGSRVRTCGAPFRLPSIARRWSIRSILAPACRCSASSVPATVSGMLPHPPMVSIRHAHGSCSRGWGWSTAMAMAFWRTGWRGGTVFGHLAAVGLDTHEDRSRGAEPVAAPRDPSRQRRPRRRRHHSALDQWRVRRNLFGVEATSYDPGNNLDFWLSSGSFHVWNAGQSAPATDWERRVDTLMQRQARTADPLARKALFRETQAVHAAHVPVICFAAPRLSIAMSPRVIHATPVPLNPPVLWNADTLAVRK